MKKRRTSTKPRPFRAAVVPGEALALDPGGAGTIAAAARGKQPTPQAFGFYFTPSQPLRFVPEAYETPYGDVVPSSIEDGVAVLHICGPLEHHDAGFSWGPHSYEALAREVGAALKHADVRAVVLKIDSPGGVAAGMGECHKAIRRLQAKHGKPVYAFADEMACSAAYHLASACAEVWTTEAGHVGSVGVILCTVDETEHLAKNGIAVRYLVTGARKADLHDGQPVTDDVVAAAQAKVDKLGRQFFRAVAKARAKAPGGTALATPEAVKALQAGVFVGDDAVKAGLADGVASWGAFLSYVKGAVRAMGMTDQSVSGKARKTTPAASRSREAKMAKKIPALGAVAADKETAKKARGMLASLAALLGVSGTAKPDAKMSKKTETTKHTIVEESETDPGEEATGSEAEEEEEEEAEDSATDMTGSDAEDSEAEEEEEEGSTGSGAEEEEEKYEEEEEARAMGLSSAAVKAAYVAADKAFLAALPKKARGSAAIRTPSRLFRAAKRATGRTSIDGVMGALSAQPVASKVNAKIAADVAKIKRETQDQAIEAVVQKAKAEGRAGATSKDGRAGLRAIGRKQGLAFLKGHVATLPKVRTEAKIPKRDEQDNGAAPGRDEQSEAMIQQMFSDLPADKREAAIADFKKRMGASAPKEKKA